MTDIASGGYFSQHYTLLILLMLVLYWLSLVILIVLAAYILGRIKGVMPIRLAQLCTTSCRWSVRVAP